MRQVAQLSQRDRATP